MNHDSNAESYGLALFSLYKVKFNPQILVFFIVFIFSLFFFIPPAFATFTVFYKDYDTVEFWYSFTENLTTCNQADFVKIYRDNALILHTDPIESNNSDRPKGPAPCSWGHSYFFKDGGLSRNKSYVYKVEYWKVTSYDSNNNPIYSKSSERSTTVTTNAIFGRLRKNLTLSGGIHKIHQLTVCNGAVLNFGSSSTVEPEKPGDSSSYTLRLGYYCNDSSTPNDTNDGEININGATIKNLTILRQTPTANQKISVDNSLLVNNIEIQIVGNGSFTNNRGLTDNASVNQEITIVEYSGSKVFENNKMPAARFILPKINQNQVITIKNNSFKEITFNTIFTSSQTTDGSITVKDNVINSNLALYSIGRTTAIDVSNNKIAGDLILQKIGGTDNSTPIYGLIKNNVLTNPSEGIIMAGASGLRVEGNVLQKGSITISQNRYYSGGSNYIKYGGNNQIIANVISSGNIRLYVVSSLLIEQNVVEESNYALLIGTSVYSNKIYSNQFRSFSRDIYFDCLNNCLNDFDNNFWSFYQGTDSNGDGIGDQWYYVDKDNSTRIKENLVDKRPRIYTALSIIKGHLNPDKQFLSSDNLTVRASHVRIFNNHPSNQALVTALTFEPFTNSRLTDIVSASLHLDSDCSGLETLIKSTTISNGRIDFTQLTQYISARSKICVSLYYTLQSPSPCAEYGTRLYADNVTASMSSISTASSGQVNSSIIAGYPNLVLTNPIDRAGEVKKALNAPIDVTWLGFNSADTPFWTAKYTFATTPLGASGYKFENNALENPVSFNQLGKAATAVTLGHKIGQYAVQIVPEPTNANPFTCPANVQPPSFQYNLFAAGIELTAQNDGNAGDALGTYLTGISANNKLTAVVRLAPGDTRTAQSVTFTLKGESKTDSAEPFEAEFDMKQCKDKDTINLSARLSDGSDLLTEYPIDAIAIPSWFNILQNIVTSIKSEFQDDEDRYAITFSYPADFIWNEAIPSWIPLLGGKEEEVKFAATIGAYFYLNRNTGFLGKAEFNTELFEKPFKVSGEVTGKFDSDFKLLPGAMAAVTGDIGFDLPEKTLAKKTILVYGVPITLSIDLGGNIKVFVSAALVLDEHLRFSQLNFTPGTQIQLDLTASASAVFGLAKLGIKGSPTATLQIKLTYTTADGVKTEAWGGEIEIPITLIGSLFWDTVSGELAKVTIGPYSFGTLGNSKGAMSAMSLIPLSTAKRFYPTASLSAGQQNTKVRIYVKDKSTSSTSINPEIVAVIHNGTNWGTEQYLTNNDYWEMDPDITMLTGNKALAVWTSNKGAKTLNHLDEIFNHQDIAWRYYNGTSWHGAEAKIIDDLKADGNARVAYDNVSDKAMAVWVHNSKDNGTVTDKSGWEIYYSVFDPQSITWTEPAPVPGTVDSSADMQPSIAADGLGNFHIVWAKDADGKLVEDVNDNYTSGSNTSLLNQDSDIYYNVFSSNSWSAAQKITTVDNHSDLMPAVGALQQHVTVAWVKKVGSADKLYFAKKTQTGWSVPEVIDDGGQLIEDPSISIVDNKAHIIYRKTVSSRDDLYIYERDLGLTAMASDNNSIRRLTNDSSSKWMSKAVVTNTKEVLSTWTTVNADMPPTVGYVEKVPDAIAIRDNITTLAKYDSMGLISGIDATVPVTILKSGTYKVRASLYDNDTGMLIDEAQAQVTGDNPNAKAVLSFSGRKIRASQQNGPYVIKDIIALSSNGNWVSEAAASLAAIYTEAFDYRLFSEERLTLDKSVYFADNASMRIKVYDELANNQSSVTVQMQTSSMHLPIVVTLPKTSDNIFEKVVALPSDPTVSGLNVNEGDAITLIYTDKSAQTWYKGTAWASGTIPKWIDLAKGWNFISIPYIAANPSFDSVFASGTDNLTIAWAYNSSTKVWGKWKGQTSHKFYSETLQTIDAHKGYWLYAKSPLRVRIGTLGDATNTVSLLQGWNLIGFNGTDNTTINQAYLEQSGLSDKWESIWTWHQGAWKVKASSAQIQQMLNLPELQSLFRGRAYWIKMKESINWTQ